MNFMGIGPLELLFLAGLIILVVGPDRLPEFAAGIGRFIVQFRRFWQDVVDSFASAAQQVPTAPEVSEALKAIQEATTLITSPPAPDVTPTASERSAPPAPVEGEAAPEPSHLQEAPPDGGARKGDLELQPAAIPHLSLQALEGWSPPQPTLLPAGSEREEVAATASPASAGAVGSSKRRRTPRRRASPKSSGPQSPEEPEPPLPSAPSLEQSGGTPGAE